MTEFPQPSSTVVKSLWRISRAAGVFAVIISCLVIVGWILNVQLLKSAYPTFVTMKANTAFAFLFCGIVLLIINSEQRKGVYHKSAEVLAGLVVLVGGLTILQYWFGINIGIDQLIFKEASGAVGTSHLGRMAPNTSINFILMGTALLLLKAKSSRLFLTSQILSLCVILITWLTFLGYLYGIKAYFGLAGYTQMAFHTSITFVVLSIGVLFASTKRGIVLIFLGDNENVVLMRRLMIAVVFLPTIIGLIRYEGEMAGLYSTDIGRILMVLSTTIMLFVIVLVAARSLYHSEENRKKILIELQKLSLAVEHSPDYVVITDVNGNIEYVNPKFSEITGYAKEEVVGKNPRILKSGKVPKEMYDEMWKTITAGKEWHGELENKKKNGEFYWEHMSLSPIFDSNKKITHFVAVNEDITYRKKVEEELKLNRDRLEELVNERTVQLQKANYELTKSEERFRTTLDNMLEGCQIIDFSYRYIYINDSAAMQGHLHKEKYIGKSMMELYPGIEKTEMFSALRRCMEKRESTFLENEFNYPDGSQSWFELSMQPVPEGVFILSFDTTERKRAEEQIRFQANLIACISDAIIATDMHLNIQSWNAGAEKLYGWKAEEVIGGPAKGILESDFLGQSREAVTKQIMEKGYWEGEAMHLHRDGKKIPTLSSVSIYRDSESKPAGIVAVNRDITERKRAEEEIKKLNEELEQRVIQRTEQLQTLNNELEAFSYSVSHDLRAPLRHINGFIDLLHKNEKDTLSEKSSRFLDIISLSSKEMGMLIDDLLHFSRVGRAALNYSNIQLKDLVLKVKDEINLQNGHNVTWKIKDLPTVNADPSLMKLVLTNLLSNAVKYSSKVESPLIEVGCSTSNDQTIIYVKDNGAGFNMKYVDKLFGVFQRLHSSDEYEGTGIGLATVRRIIHKHGGKTWAEAEEGKGATFYFSLPLNHEKIVIS